MKYRINDIEYNVEINSLSVNKAEVSVHGVAYQVEIGGNEAPAAAPMPVAFAPSEAKAPVMPEEPRNAVAAGDGKPVSSPLPGVIISVTVKAGDRVKAGQVVAILEAMKMENEIQAEFDGTVTSVHVSQGDSILEGSPIVTLS